MSDFEAIVFLTAALLVSLAVSFFIVYVTAWLLWHLVKWVRSKIDSDYDFRYEGVLGLFEGEQEMWDDDRVH